MQVLDPKRLIQEFDLSHKCEYIEFKHAHLKELLETYLKHDEREVVLEVLEEHIQFHKTRAQQLYMQGFKDCVKLFKEIGAI